MSLELQPPLKKRKKLWKLLVRVTRYLEKKGIPYWIDSGTLLGFIREKGFLPQFKNINIGIPAEYFQQIADMSPYTFFPYRLKPSYDRAGVEWIPGYRNSIYTKPIFYFRSQNIPLHLTPKFTSGDTVRWIDGINGRTCKEAAASFFQKRETITIQGVPFSVPQNSSEYLTVRYGEWKNPTSRWNTNTNDGAIIDEKTRESLPKKTRGADRKSRFRRKMRLSGKDLLRAKTMLEDTVTILERNNIPYWLDAGTLLGIIRDNELIPWDYDIDLSVSSTTIKRILSLKKQFLPKYRLINRLDYSERLPDIYRSCKVKLILGKLSLLKKKQELHLDIFFKYKVDSHYYWIDSSITKRVDSRFHDSLDTITWNGRQYSIPAHVEDYLTQRYGEDWRTPKENYDASIDDHSIYV